MGVDLWGEVDREVVQSPVRKRDSLRRQYAKCFFVSEVKGEGNDPNHPVGASDSAKRKKRTTAALVHFIVSQCI